MFVQTQRQYETLLETEHASVDLLANPFFFASILLGNGKKGYSLYKQH